MARLPMTLAATPTRTTCCCLLRLSSTTTASTTTWPTLALSHPSSLRVHARHATLVVRPRRPYKFTQMVRLSDGSTYMVRTTSPEPLHLAEKDTRNAPMWQPSNQSLHNIELDEAGRLAAFRGRFGRSFDAVTNKAQQEIKDGDGHDNDDGHDGVDKDKALEAGDGHKQAADDQEAAAGAADGFSADMFSDLLSGYKPNESASTMQDSKKGKTKK